MPKDSLNTLMNMFPYFFNKSETSNFNKSQSVTNNRLRDLYQSLFDVKESFRLGKNVWIWKEQETSYEYTMYFFAEYPHIKSVKICKNDNVIYSQEYTYEENNTLFNYSYVSDTRNDLENENLEADIIPLDEFTIEVETYDETIIQKGFPENDTLLGNIFDHDISLDEIGAFHNIPRKNYIPTTEYDHTEPPYNDRLTEDDYHYMKRMLEYMLKLHEVPLPILEIWKLYGVNATMLNRERLLVKMFDITKHPHHVNEDGELVVDEWTPKTWEHKDQFCKAENLLGEFFTASASNVSPVKHRPITFTFKFVNSLMETLTDERYVADVYLNGTLILEGYHGQEWHCSSDILDEYEDNIFHIVGRKDDEIIGEVDIIITVKGCNAADIYVKGDTGSDSNSGDIEHPFKTITKGVNSVTDANNTIALIGETNNTTGNNIIKKDTSIMGCNNATLTNGNNPIFFKINKDKTLDVQDITFVTEHSEGSPGIISWANDKDSIVVETAVAYTVENSILVTDLIPQKWIKNLRLNTTTGVLLWEEYITSEFTKLSDLDGIDTSLSLTEYLCFNEFSPIETDALNLNRPFVSVLNREGLSGAFSDLALDSTTGLLTYTEYEDEEIIWDGQLHNIFGDENDGE